MPEKRYDTVLTLFDPVEKVDKTGQRSYNREDSNKTIMWEKTL